MKALFYSKNNQILYRIFLGFFMWIWIILKKLCALYAHLHENRLKSQQQLVIFNLDKFYHFEICH